MVSSSTGNVKLKSSSLKGNSRLSELISLVPFFYHLDLTQARSSMRAVICSGFVSFYLRMQSAVILFTLVFYIYYLD